MENGVLMIMRKLHNDVELDSPIGMTVRHIVI